MPADAYDHAQLTALIARENDLEEALEEAREQVLLWVKRGRLAVKHRRRDLAVEAKARAASAKERFMSTQAELDTIAAQKNRLRREARRPDDEQTFQAEMLVEQFKLQGFDPTEQETKEIAQRVEAEMELAAMKGEPVPHAAVQPTVNAPSLDLDIDADETPAPSAVASVRANTDSAQATDSASVRETPSTQAPVEPPPTDAPVTPPIVDESAVLSELEELKAIARASEPTEETDDDIAALERELMAPKNGEEPTS